MVRECERDDRKSWINADVFEQIGLDQKLDRIDIIHDANIITRAVNIDLLLDDSEITLCPADQEALNAKPGAKVTIRRHTDKEGQVQGMDLRTTSI